jgi:hypothetical protein
MGEILGRPSDPLLSRKIYEIFAAQPAECARPPLRLGLPR